MSQNPFFQEIPPGQRLVQKTKGRKVFYYYEPIPYFELPHVRRRTSLILLLLFVFISLIFIFAA